MTTDEKRAYLQRTHARAAEGSARRIWAAAQLAMLDKMAAGDRLTKNEGRRTKR